MAIPLSANHDSIEEQYQRLERILYELYLVLRALMEPQAQPLPPAANQQPPRGGSGGAGSRRNRRRNNSDSSSSLTGGRRCCSNGCSCQNGPQNPPPPPPPGCGDSSVTTASAASATKLMLLNLANAAAGKRTAVPGCAVVDSVQWGKLGCDLRSVADSLNAAKCQELAPNSPLKSSSSTSSSSTLKLVTMALSLMMSRDLSSN